jgi:hypothetical protein
MSKSSVTVAEGLNSQSVSVPAQALNISKKHNKINFMKDI